MAEKKIIVQNKSGRPDNIVEKESELFEECEKIQGNMPKFLRGFFVYLKGNVLPMTRLAYLRDIETFFDYLISETDLTEARETAEIKLSDLKEVKAVDVNLYLDYMRKYKKQIGDTTYWFENNNRSLARKKSSLSVLFKQLYRDEMLPKNITDGFDPIRVPKAGEREIKALQDDEVMIMLDAVTNGTGLSKREHTFWEKTKKRDKAILVVFLTYGLRLSELQQLNVSSFNFKRGEFVIYRKRGKESVMPLNDSVTMVVKDYMEHERPEDDRIIDGEKDALFLSLRGKRMTERQIRTLVKKYTAIGMSTVRDNGYSPHKLRATAATSLIGRGESIYDVAALLDHEQVTTTQLYAKQKVNVKRDLVHDMEWEKERKGSEGRRPPEDGDEK